MEIVLCLQFLSSLSLLFAESLFKVRDLFLGRHFGDISVLQFLTVNSGGRLFVRIINIR